MGLVGGARELARDRDHFGARHAGDLLLPGRGARHVVIETAGDIGAAEAAIHAVLSQQQVVHGRDRPLLAVGELQFAHRNVALEHVFEFRRSPAVVFDAAEVRKAHRLNAVVGILEA